MLEPANGAFDVTVAPGEDVQAAVNACPPGGCVLLLPGTHAGPLALRADKEVHVFGRGQATLRAANVDVLTSTASKSTVDGLLVRQEGTGDLALDSSAFCGVVVKQGALRLQACQISGESLQGAGLWASGGDPVISACTCGGGASF